MFDLEKDERNIKKKKITSADYWFFFISLIIFIRT